ncbi:MAG: hypothetical protein SFZ24_01045 [Planctomycetota bacterium]|nr:hypothetical protein [Planctomycetota bacterium]
MEAPTTNLYRPGMRVRIHQQIPFAKGTTAMHVEGVIQRFGQQKTGSWFAHGRDDKLWLDRLELRKDDGEIVVFNLDQYSRVEVLSSPAAAE